METNEEIEQGRRMIEKSRQLIAEIQDLPLWKVFTILRKKKELDKNIRETTRFICK